ncbi:Uncharacterised protein [Mycobacteroides abscessus subsp. abscessus]|nr:Uncharacterised protein [Mycobacteroides abscessus subsp. abscessus]
MSSPRLPVYVARRFSADGSGARNSGAPSQSSHRVPVADVGSAT